MNLHHMTIEQLQRDTHPILHVLHSHFRGKPEIPYQPAHEHSHGHVSVLVANAIPLASAESHIRVLMLAADVLRQKVIRIECICIRSPNGWVSLDMNDGYRDFSTRREDHIICELIMIF